MATNRKTVEYIVEQAAAAGVIVAKPMFGEYGLNCDGKMIAIIGDEKLFIKLTTGGCALPRAHKPGTRVDVTSIKSSCCFRMD
jgi:DNA transformation protein